jgi:hypothetical protein
MTLGGNWNWNWRGPHEELQNNHHGGTYEDGKGKQGKVVG